MPGNTAIVRGNASLLQVLKSDTLAPSAFSTTSANTVVTLNGIKAGDMVDVYPPSIVLGVSVGSVISATNQITIQFTNGTGGSVTPAAASTSAPYLFLVTRYENEYPRGIPKALV